MDLRQGPVRGGNRGGQGLFKWEDIKEDKHRENYLGHSLKAPMGRWQKGRDLEWFNKKKDSQLSNEEIRREEIKRIKEAEEDALAEALGFKVTRKKEEKVNEKEIAKAIESTEGDHVEKAVKDENNEGLGFHGGAYKYGIRNIGESDLVERQDGTRGGVQDGDRQDKNKQLRTRDDGITTRKYNDRERRYRNNSPERRYRAYSPDRKRRHRSPSLERGSYRASQDKKYQTGHWERGYRDNRERHREDDYWDRKYSKGYHHSFRERTRHKERDYSPERDQRHRI